MTMEKAQHKSVLNIKLTKANDNITELNNNNNGKRNRLHSNMSLFWQAGNSNDYDDRACQGAYK